MTPKSFLTVVAALASVTGVAILVGTAPVVRSLGWPTIPAPESADLEAMSVWWGFSFVRLTGVLLLSIGLIVWEVRRSLHPDAQRRLVSLLTVILFGLSVLAGLQTVAIWSSTAGWGVAAGLMVLGLLGLWTVRRGADGARSAAVV